MKKETDVKKIEFPPTVVDSLGNGFGGNGMSGNGMNGNGLGTDFKLSSKDIEELIKDLN